VRERGYNGFSLKVVRAIREIDLAGPPRTLYDPRR
jgi:hypothetical protein